MDIAAILILRYPNTEWILQGDTYETLIWISDTPKRTENELAELWPEVQADLEAKKQAKIDAKASLLAKLESLGLTEEEIAAL